MFQSPQILLVSPVSNSEIGRILTRHENQHIPLGRGDGTVNLHDLVRGSFDEIVDWLNDVSSSDIIHPSFDQ
jgi:hypothetical protein